MHAHGTFTGSAFSHAYGCAAAFSAVRPRVRRGERIVFKTRNSPRCWKTDRFLKDFVSLDEAAARWLVDRRVRTVGIDYLSIAGYESDTAAIHTILLKGGI